MVDCFHRPTWNNTFMGITELLSKRSTCAKLQTAAIVVRDKRIVSMGYNGVPSDTEHCMEYWKIFYATKLKYGQNIENYENWLSSPEFLQEHHAWATNNELHAEQNALLYACKIGISTNEATMYTLFSPCIHCAKVILTAGITVVYYKHIYSRDVEAFNFLKNNNVTLECIS